MHSYKIKNRTGISKIVISIVIIFISLSLVSCQQFLNNELQNNEQDIKPSEILYNNDDILDSGPINGGTLNLFSTAPDTLNPLLTKNLSVSEFLGLIYESPVKLDKDQKPLPALSDSWSVSADGLEWNFHIRENVRWSNGEILTARDIAFTIDCILNKDINSVYKSQLLNISGFSATDSMNLRLVLIKPNSFTAETLTFPVLQKALGKKALSAADFIPLGTGPYKYTAYEKNKSVILKKNADWWYLNSDEGNTKDLLYLDNIVVKIYDSLNDAVNAYFSGDIDILPVGIEDFGKYEGRSDLYLKKYISRDFEFLAFNLNNPVMADLSLRKAIAAALDKEKIVNEVYNGNALVFDLPINPEAWIFGGKSGKALPELNPKEILIEGGWKETEKGFKKSFDGVYKKLNLELIINDNNIKRAEIADKICQQLQYYGINTVVKKLTWNDLFARLTLAEFDMTFTGCRISQIPDLSFLYSNPYLAPLTPINTDAARNISGYNSPVVSDLIDMIYKENDFDNRKILYTKMDTELSKDIPYIGFCFLKNGIIYRKNVRGILEPFTWNRYYDITGWYKSQN